MSEVGEGPGVARADPGTPEGATRIAQLRGLAADAFALGQAALAAGDAAGAVRAFARAHRLAKGDPVVALTLAAARLGTDPAAAAAGFEPLAARHDLHAAWTGLAAARLRLGEAGAAAAAMGRALSGHAMRDGDAALADAVARAAGLPGWAGMDARFRAVTSVGGPVRWGRVVRVAPFRPGPGARTLPVATSEGVALLGSPLRPAAIRRIEGVCEDDGAGGIAGWAHHPASPGTVPRLWLLDAAGHRRRVAWRGPAEDGPAEEGPAEGATGEGAGPLARPVAFAEAAAALAGWTPPFRVVGGDGRDLPGSPVHPGLRRPAATLVRARPAARARPEGVAVVMPVRDGGAVVIDCLASVVAALGRDDRLILVDDGSREPDVRAALRAYGATGLATVIRHERGLGFPRAANAGLRARPPGWDAVLLNSDVLVPKFWARRLRRAVEASPDIASASPLSNDATILSYPRADRANPAPDQAGTDALDLLAEAANRDVAVDVPTTVGFCMYLRDAALEGVGPLEEMLFAQGYGEENDWCQRAVRQGWRHVAVPGVFVAHVSGASFGAARGPLLRRNMAVLAREHPGYFAAVAGFVAADPLAPARAALDRARLLAAVRPGPLVLVTHDQGGGVERVVAAERRAAGARGQNVVILRPGAEGAPGGETVVAEGPAGPTPNLRFALPGAAGGLRALLAGLRARSITVHHLVGHDPALGPLLMGLGPPVDIFVHDYAGVCAQATFVGPAARYCGEPDPDACVACVAARGTRVSDPGPVAAMRERTAALWRAAARVRVPSADAAARLRRYVPGLAVAVEPLDAISPPARAPAPPKPGMPWRVAVLGAIGTEKGLEVLESLADDSAKRNLALFYSLIGYAEREDGLLRSGRVSITGPYTGAERPALIEAEECHLALLPSVWPETWSFTLSEAWEAGLPTLCFDLGAPAARIRAAGPARPGMVAGEILPLGLPVPRLSEAILAAAGRLCGGTAGRLASR